MSNQPYPQLFDTYENALNSCISGSYQYHNLVKVVIEKNRILYSATDEVPEFELASMRAVMAVGLSMNNKKIRVLDFGGGGGFHWMTCKKAFDQDVIFDWDVVETPGMAAAARQSISGLGLQFFDSIESSLEKKELRDLVIASSSLQYCSSPAKALKDLVDLGARYLFITRTPFSLTQKTLISTQRSMLSENGPGPMPSGFVDELIEYPITYIPKFEALQIIESKYKIRFSLLEESGTLYFDNFAVNNYYGVFCEKK